MPRKIFALHLLFSLCALVTLLVGLVWLGEKVRTQAFNNACLLSVNKSQANLVISYLCQSDTDLQSHVTQLQQDHRFEFCAVVDPHGEFIAHSDETKISHVFREPVGKRSFYGEVTEVRYVDGKKTGIRQFSAPLKTDSGTFGTLKVGVQDYGSNQMLLNFIREIPLVLLLPLSLLVAGGFVLKRKLMPTADVQGQLANLATSTNFDPAQLEPVDVSGATSIGWNRLIDEIQESSASDGLTSRLASAVEAIQSTNSQNLLESLPYGVAETDAQGKITMINRAMETLLGMESSQVGKPLADFIEIESDSEAYRQLLDEKALRRVGASEITRPSDDGERVLKVTRQPVRNADSSCSNQAWSIRDVTQLKLADKARDEFLDSATHEIRTPLSNIKAYAETLALTDQLDVEQQKEFCNIINGEATRLARFIDELLDVSSMEAGSMAIQKQKIELSRLLEDVFTKVKPTMLKKDIEFVQQMDDKLPEIVVDKDKFSTCLINLLGNATKYTPEGGLVTFRARTLDNKLQIEIEDNGVGISKEDLPKVFKKFFRSADTRVLDESGTGLGLAFTREIVRLHGGTVTAESELNEGSLFTIQLPLG